MSNPFFNLLNSLINWIAILVIPSGILAIIITSIYVAIGGSEAKQKAKKAYVWILIAVGIGLSAKGIMSLVERFVKQSGF